MADDTSKRAADRKRINVHEDYELRYWTETLGVSAERLKDAVQKVGPMVDDVERELGKERTGGDPGLGIRENQRYVRSCLLSIAS